jgi:hypothetical protein
VDKDGGLETAHSTNVDVDEALELEGENDPRWAKHAESTEGIPAVNDTLALLLSAFMAGFWEC